ncbi:hypothetical protein GQ43DRAFT_284769 [Delitschia confertaspora ATCC 74209]|uniref:PHD-type domain-containing protein n=1 Tax=Delitschia confertaspora ATCC 74209 TaxID=1513339 RepID=A0A9P4JPB3_9PLEO|nr:hypothetical protein GQ43DRAFT_284769 [Delitschia confertaspora ATCC 74209]
MALEPPGNSPSQGPVPVRFDGLKTGLDGAGTKRKYVKGGKYAKKNQLRKTIPNKFKSDTVILKSNSVDEDNAAVDGMGASRTVGEDKALPGSAERPSDLIETSASGVTTNSSAKLEVPVAEQPRKKMKYIKSAVSADKKVNGRSKPVSEGLTIGDDSMTEHDIAVVQTKAENKPGNLGFDCKEETLQNVSRRSARHSAGNIATYDVLNLAGAARHTPTKYLEKHHHQQVLHSIDRGSLSGKTKTSTGKVAPDGTHQVEAQGSEHGVAHAPSLFAQPQYPSSVTKTVGLLNPVKETILVQTQIANDAAHDGHNCDDVDIDMVEVPTYGHEGEEEGTHGHYSLGSEIDMDVDFEHLCFPSSAPLLPFPPQWAPINAPLIGFIGTPPINASMIQNDLTWSGKKAENLASTPPRKISHALVLDAAERAGVMVSERQRQFLDEVEITSPRRRGPSMTAVPASPSSRVPASPGAFGGDITSLSPARLFTVREGIQLPLRSRSSSVYTVPPRAVTPVEQTATFAPSPFRSHFYSDLSDSKVQQNILKRIECAQKTRAAIEVVLEQANRDAIKVYNDAQLLQRYNQMTGGNFETLHEANIDHYMNKDPVALFRSSVSPENSPLSAKKGANLVPIPPSNNRIPHPNTGGSSAHMTYHELPCCQCRKPSEGERMVECQDPNCLVRWYHYDCLTTNEKRSSSISPYRWICEPCKLRDRDSWAVKKESHGYEENEENDEDNDGEVEVDVKGLRALERKHVEYVLEKLTWPGVAVKNPYGL